MKIITLVFSLALSPCVMAAGEVFKLNTSGTQYCRGFRPQVFGPSNDIDLWMRINGPTSATVYDDAALISVVANLDVDCAIISSKKAACSMFSGDASDHFAGVGTIIVDSFGLVKSIKGTYVRKGLLNPCFSKGKLTGRRIN
jgi:hypothetical protein